jgi:hypothetical protein
MTKHSLSKEWNKMQRKWWWDKEQKEDSVEEMSWKLIGLSLPGSHSSTQWHTPQKPSFRSSDCPHSRTLPVVLKIGGSFRLKQPTVWHGKILNWYSPCGSFQTRILPPIIAKCFVKNPCRQMRRRVDHWSVFEEIPDAETRPLTRVKLNRAILRLAFFAELYLARLLLCL